MTNNWIELKRHTPEKMELARLALVDIREGLDVVDALRRYPIRSKGGGYIGKQMLVAVYRELIETGEWEPDANLLARIRMKPTRTQSGVTVVTVLTTTGLATAAVPLMQASSGENPNSR